jgi:hypothetical protein
MRIYSEKQVRAATFLASPIAGGILMAQNARRAGKGGRQLGIYGISALVLAVMLGIGYALERGTARSGSFLFPLLAAAFYSLWYRRTQGEFLTAKYPGA